MLVKTPSLPIPVGGRLSGDNVLYPTHMVWFSDIPLCAIEKAQRDRFGSESPGQYHHFAGIRTCREARAWRE
jgi:hypothetical protein